MWINAEVETPSHGHKVVIVMGDSEVVFGQYNVWDRLWFDSDGDCLDGSFPEVTVTYWMDLPPNPNFQ